MTGCFIFGIRLFYYVLLVFCQHLSAQLYAHDMKFGVLEATELHTGNYQVAFRYSSTQLDLGKVSLMQAPDCQVQDFVDSSLHGNQVKFSWRAICDNTVSYPTFTLYGLPQKQQIFVKIWRMNGTVVEQMTNSNRIDLGKLVQASLTSPKSNATIHYLKFGFEHILEGYDHLLVVLCFLLLFPRTYTLLLVVTGFTLGHSLSLILATGLGWQFPVALVEIFIVLSVTFMAREVYLAEHKSLLKLYPVVISCLIGLLHGLGFANSILAFGLPKDHSLIAILFFNLGVEIGQLCFVIFGIIILFALARLGVARPMLHKPAAVIIGATSILWLFLLYANG